MKKAAQLSPIPVYAMIRPRQGDFCYNSDDIDSMLLDIEAAASVGLQGVVFGLLTPDGRVDVENAAPLVQQAKKYGLGVTFHRAIDMAVDPLIALEAIIKLGCERVLSSGLAPKAIEGQETLKEMIEQANQRISIMAGAGVNAKNVLTIVNNTGTREVHLSGKTTRPSAMEVSDQSVKMGSSDIDEFQIPITSSESIRQVVDQLKSFK